MRKRCERRASDLAQELPEREGAGKLTPERQHIYEQPYQPFGLRSSSAGDRSTYHDVILPAVFVEQRFERSKQRHIKCGALSTTKSSQRVAHSGR